MAAPKVVIIGAGFAGLTCARRLAGKPIEVLLLDKNNYHLFTPLLYQVASSLLAPSHIAYPLRAVFRRAKNVRFRLAEVTSVNFNTKIVKTADGTEMPYDYVVIAAGSTTNFFGMKAVEEVAHELKDIPEALELRNHILRCFEAAAYATDEEARRKWLTFVVVGGGPTGVEYAGALSELIRLVLVRDYPELDVMNTVRIMLIEALGQLLPAFSSTLGHYAQRVLEQRRIEVRLNTRVLEVSGETIQLSTGEQIETKTLIWAAGVKPSVLAATLEVLRSRSGRIKVDESLRVIGQECAFAIGDIASFVQEGKELPMMAPPAIQEARHVAESILRLEHGQPLAPFRYHDKGAMATIGRNSAVAQVGRFALTGFIGWVTWLLVHLYYIIGFRNRIAVLLSWAWEYIRYDRPVRLIARAKESKPPGSAPP